MAIKTQKELTSAELKEKISPRQITPKQQKGQKLRFAVLLKAATKGKTSSAVTIPKLPGEEKSKVLQITLMDGIYYFPKSWSHSESVRALNAFKAAGFLDATYTEKDATPKEIPTQYEYTMAHPDNGSTPESKVRGNYAIKVDGKDISLEIDDGYIKTRDNGVYTELLRQKWHEIVRVPIKNKADAEKKAKANN